MAPAASVPLDGKRVAVLGTGCSAIQAVPAIQPIVAQVDVYQRSPGWTLPKMDFPYSERSRRLFERFPVLQRLDRMAIFASMELLAAGMTRHRWLLAPFRGLGRRQIRGAIKDDELRARVTPSDEVGCKRVMLTDEWYPTLTKPNVELVTDPIAAVTPTGLRLADGSDRPADVIVLATGFKTQGFVAPMEIIGKGGRTLAAEWEQVPRAYLGMSVPNFPNMFMLYGPNTNMGAGSAIFLLESQMRHVAQAVGLLRRTRGRSLEVRPDAQVAFNQEMRGRLARSVWESGCSNWYVDEQGHDTSNWPGTMTEFRRRSAKVSLGDYRLDLAPVEQRPLAPPA